MMTLMIRGSPAWISTRWMQRARRSSIGTRCSSWVLHKTPLPCLGRTSRAPIRTACSKRRALTIHRRESQTRTDFGTELVETERRAVRNVGARDARAGCETPIRVSRVVRGTGQRRNIMDQTKSAADKITIAREYLARVFNEHKPDRAIDYVTSDVVWHGGSLGTVRGAQALAGLLGVFIGALPDLQADE